MEELTVRLFEAVATLPVADFRTVLGELSSTRQEWSEGHLNPMVLVAGYWAERDLPAALAWASQTNDHALTQPVFLTWAWQDPQRFFEWAVSDAGKALPAGARLALLNVVAGSATLHDPRRGLAILRKLQPNQPQLGPAADLYYEWARADPQAAAQEADRETDAPRRVQAIQEVAKQWVKQDAQAAFAWVGEKLDPLAADMVWPQMAESLGQERLRESVLFLMSVPQTERVLMSLGRALRQWAEDEPVQVLQWAAQDTPPGIPPEIVASAIAPAVARVGPFRTLSREGQQNILKLMQAGGARVDELEVRP